MHSRLSAAFLIRGKCAAGRITPLGSLQEITTPIHRSPVVTTGPAPRNQSPLQHAFIEFLRGLGSELAHAEQQKRHDFFPMGLREETEINQLQAHDEN